MGRGTPYKQSRITVSPKTLIFYTLPWNVNPHFIGVVSLVVAFTSESNFSLQSVAQKTSLLDVDSENVSMYVVYCNGLVTR